MLLSVVPGVRQRPGHSVRGRAGGRTAEVRCAVLVLPLQLAVHRQHHASLAVVAGEPCGASRNGGSAGHSLWSLWLSSRSCFLYIVCRCHAVPCAHVLAEAHEGFRPPPICSFRVCLPLSVCFRYFAAEPPTRLLYAALLLAGVPRVAGGQGTPPGSAR